jgi:AcrR family transcriptional regulator
MPRETLTRDQVVEAAIAILDEDGYDALSMRRLAQRLDAAAPTLYWHVKNRDGLLDLIADDIVGEMLAEIGSPVGWRAWMSALARALRDVLGRHAGVAPIIGLRPLAGTNASEALGRLLEALRRDGFTDEQAALAATTLTGWASGFAVLEARDRAGATVPPGLPDVAARFEYGLAVVLDGIEADMLRRQDGDRRPVDGLDEDRSKGKRHKRDEERSKGKHQRKGDERRKGDHRPR